MRQSDGFPIAFFVRPRVSGIPPRPRGLTQTATRTCRISRKKDSLCAIPRKDARGSEGKDERSEVNPAGIRKSKMSHTLSVRHSSQGRPRQRRERRAKRSQSRKSASRQNIRNPSARFPSPAGATAQKQRLMQRTTVHDKSGAIDFSCDRSFDRERDRRYPNRRAFRARRQNG